MRIISRFKEGFSSSWGRRRRNIPDFRTDQKKGMKSFLEMISDEKELPIQHVLLLNAKRYYLNDELRLMYIELSIAFENFVSRA